jgi:hypothetical protein
MGAATLDESEARGVRPVADAHSAASSALRSTRSSSRAQNPFWFVRALVASNGTSSR